MKTNLKSRRRKNFLDVKQDRLSQLPDEVIGYILSFIPIKGAIQTSVLSKRWINLWTLVTSVEFDEIIHNTRSCIDLVDNVLDCCTAPTINRFCMELDKYVYPHRVNEWVNKVARRNLRELRLEGSVFPESIFTCKTLTVLKLFSDSLDIQLDVPYSFNLPNLKILHICLDSIPPSSLLTDRLFSSCPVLEDLTLQGVAAIDVTFNLSCPLLKRLKIHLVPFNLEGLRCELHINAPNLKYLEIIDISTAEYVVDKLPSIVEAKMEIGEAPISPMFANTAFELLWACSTLKFLLLDQVYLAVLRCAASTPPLDLPSFINMNRLELYVNYCSDAQLIARFLTACPKLEVLVFHEDCLQFPFSDNTNYFSDIKDIPECLSSHIKVVEFEGFQGTPYQFDFVRYFLANSLVLEKLTIKFRTTTPALYVMRSNTCYSCLICKF